MKRENISLSGPFRTRDFGSMDHLQSLQLAVHGWAEYLLPLRCVPDSSSGALHCGVVLVPPGQSHLDVRLLACRCNVQVLVLTWSLLVQAYIPPPGGKRLRRI